MPAADAPLPTVALVTLGCARNEVDSEEVAAGLVRAGWLLVEEPERASVVLVNTCGFIDAAKKDSIDTLMAAADLKDGGVTRAVVAIGCLAERYGADLAAELTEADAVLGFDDYPALAGRLAAVLAGQRPAAHQPRDRRTLLPLAPVDRPQSAPTVSLPGHAASRRRLTDGPVAPLKIASGCDRRCSFCAIPSFRGAYTSRPVDELVAEAQWLAGQGVRELVLVSENSSSYGKDLGDRLALEKLLPALAGVGGIARVRVSYLQPAEMRPSLIDVMTSTPGVAPYFDLSFQHSSERVLRAMRRFGGTADFLALVDSIRGRAGDAGIRSNVIVGFPGESDDDVAELERFLTEARLDAVGVFGYSDEDGTEAETYGDKVPAEAIEERVTRLSELVEELTAQRAQDRVGSVLDVLVDEPSGDAAGSDGRLAVEGRGAHQAPEVDGSVTVTLPPGAERPSPGDVVRVRVTASQGIDLVGTLVERDA